ncbi:MAG: TolC family protein [Bdellovibrionales bacterium]|nr:TolC family protein [Bdellovibrionales bacterium]
MKAFILTIFISLSLSYSGWAQTCQFNEVFVYQSAIEKSDELKIAKLQQKEFETNKGQLDAMYDGQLDARISHQIDKSDRVISVFGTRTDTTQFQTQYSKYFDLGLSLQTGFRQTREKTNGPFATINPAFNSIWFGQLNIPLLQSLERNNDILRNSYTVAIDGVSLETHYAQMQIGFQALQTYMLWLQAKKEIELAEQALDRAQKYDQTTQRLYKNGLVEKSSYFAAQSNVSMRKEDVLATRNRFETIDRDLKHLLKVDFQTECSNEDIHQASNFTKDQYLEYANRRLDIQALDKKIESAEIELSAYRKELLPNLEAFTRLEVNNVDGSLGDAFGSSLSTDHTNWSVGGQFSMPFGKSLAKTKVERGKIQIETLSLEKDKTKREIKRDILNAWNDWDMLNQRITQMNQTVTFEDQKIKSTKKEYDLGRESFLTLLIFEQDFVQIKRKLLALETEQRVQKLLLALLSGIEPIQERP